MSHAHSQHVPQNAAPSSSWSQVHAARLLRTNDDEWMRIVVCSAQSLDDPSRVIDDVLGRLGQECRDLSNLEASNGSDLT
mmetsp:Transcript_52436/g.137279  ORF Transcript_52436/g.137279 Transcript_52436/m.137279 type:complete len:80 (-) Transcript_52436:8-247(-)